MRLEKKSRAEKRIERVPVREARTFDLLDALNRYNDEGFMPAGAYMRRPGIGKTREEIVMYPGSGEDVLKHEQTHAAQTSRLARFLGLEGKTQNKDLRKAISKASRMLTPEQVSGLSEAGKYFLDPREMEATVNAVSSDLNAMGVSDETSFDDLKKILSSNNMLSTNMRNLSLFMDNDWSDKQKSLIMQAIRSKK